MVRIDYYLKHDFKHCYYASYTYLKAPRFNLLKGGEGFIDLAQTAIQPNKGVIADWVNIGEIARMVVTEIEKEREGE